jgi:hypothetical protein
MRNMARSGPSPPSRVAYSLPRRVSLAPVLVTVASSMSRTRSVGGRLARMQAMTASTFDGAADAAGLSSAAVSNRTTMPGWFMVPPVCRRVGILAPGNLVRMS